MRRRTLLSAAACAATTAAMLPLSAGSAGAANPAPAAAQASSTTGTLNGDTFVKVPSLSSSSFTGDGPYSVGTYTVNISVTDANGVTYQTPVDVWYPAKAPTSSTAVRASYNVGTWLPPFFQGLVNTPEKVALEQQATYVEDAYQYGKTKTKKGVTTGTPLKTAKGKFPLVLFSHGYSGFRDQSTYLTTHLASWGFVVAAPDQQGRVLTTVLNSYIGVPGPTTDRNADVTELLDTVNLFSSGNGGLAQSITDPTHVIAFGHSAGGSAVERLASYESSGGGSSVLKGFIGMAGADFGGIATLSPPYNTLPTMPGVIVGGDSDKVVTPGGLQTAYNDLTAAKRYVELTGAGHQVFSDLCQIAPGVGGLTVLASAIGIDLAATNLGTLATDGCFSPDTPVTTDWPVIDQLVVGSARQMLGFDTTTAGVANLATDNPTLVGTDTTANLP